ncbi:MAG: arginine deiminase-related protein [Chitinophagales bacterium]
MKQTNITSTILMVRPVAFDANEETMDSNAFQEERTDESAKQVQSKAVREFDAFVDKLRIYGIEVIVFDDRLQPRTPDSIFPNNWISFHNNGRVMTYPMQAISRRLERRTDIIESLQQEYGFEVTQVIDMGPLYEAEDRFLEGTGSLIIDRNDRYVYACISPRTHRELVEDWAEYWGFEAIIFEALDEQGQQIYHTNVLMCLGDAFVVICMEAIRDASERKQVEESFESSERTVVEISFDQMNHFAGNMLQLQNEQSEKILVMSQAAYDSLSSEQIEILQGFNDHLVSSPIPTIEKYGGGSVRCMMAEVFLPKKINQHA